MERRISGLISLFEVNQDMLCAPGNVVMEMKRGPRSQERNVVGWSAAKMKSGTHTAAFGCGKKATAFTMLIRKPMWGNLDLQPV